MAGRFGWLKERKNGKRIMLMTEKQLVNAKAKLERLNTIYKVLLDARSSIVEVTTRIDLKDALDTETHLNTRKVTDELKNECFGIYDEMVDLKCKIELLEELENEASK